MHVKTTKTRAGSGFDARRSFSAFGSGTLYHCYARQCQAISPSLWSHLKRPALALPLPHAPYLRARSLASSRLSCQGDTIRWTCDETWHAFAAASIILPRVAGAKWLVVFVVVAVVVILAAGIPKRSVLDRRSFLSRLLQFSFRRMLAEGSAFVGRVQNTAVALLAPSCKRAW